jgi:ribonuclease J
MKAIIYRGTHEIGGTLIELSSGSSRILLDAGYPLLLGGKPIEDSVAKLPPEELLERGVLPRISGLYKWDQPGFDGIIISHAHLDHYGLLKYVHPDIPVYLSAGTKALIEISQSFNICEPYAINARLFKMYEPMEVGGFRVRPYLMDHSAFDSAAFEIQCEGKTVIYSGDFRGHGRKAACLDSFIKQATKEADVVFTEGTMLSRSDELTKTESELEDDIVEKLKNKTGIALVQLSSQNIDRIVTLYRAALKLGKIFVVDVYTANILHELQALGNNIPYPSASFDRIKVFFPHRLTTTIINRMGWKYARRFSHFKITKKQVEERQNEIIMLARPSIKKDLGLCNLSNGNFIYSMWEGYRDSQYQQSFEAWLKGFGFQNDYVHTSGHARAMDIKRLIDGLNPKKIVPIHTLVPDALLGYSDKAVCQEDGVVFDV